MALELDDSKDCFIMDGNNAFGRCNRFEALRQVKQLQPALSPFLCSRYSDTSSGWFFGPSDGIAKVDCQEGVLQGDVFGSWLFNLTIHPFVKSIDIIIIIIIIIIINIIIIITIPVLPP